MNNKTKCIIGAVALLLSGILTALFLVRYQKDWIMLIAVILFSVLYLKCFRSEEVIKRVHDRFSKKQLSVVAIILIFIGLLLLPNSSGALINESLHVVVYTISFICWMIGMLFLVIRYNV